MTSVGQPVRLALRLRRWAGPRAVHLSAGDPRPARMAERLHRGQSRRPQRMDTRRTPRRCRQPATKADRGCLMGIPGRLGLPCRGACRLARSAPRACTPCIRAQSRLRSSEPDRRELNWRLNAHQAARQEPHRPYWRGSGPWAGCHRSCLHIYRNTYYVECIITCLGH